MNKEEALRFYKKYNEKCNAYELALKTMSYDMSTIAPVDGNAYRIEMMTILSGELFEYQTDPENMKKLIELSHMDLGEIMNKEIKLVLKDLQKVSLLPKDFFMKMKATYGHGEVLWRQAKQANDYQMFKDCLKEIVAVTKQAYTYYGVKKSLYDDMLDTFEPGMNIEKYDLFFDTIKQRLVPFIKAINEKGTMIDDHLLYQYYPENKQIKVMDILKEYMGFNKNECYLGTTEHPFTTDFSSHDVRITTKYVENSLTSSIFSIIHEYGHALYALHVDEKLAHLKVGKDMTCGMHESQSRFLENYIGRRKAFWINNYPQIQEIFKNELQDISLDEFVKLINVTKPSLIRTEADELTYPLHILIRYELEKDMMNGDVDFDHLDTLWADKYEQYLGIRPLDARTGVLQDVHWSTGDFGYFPTYALGSAFAAQFLKAMEKEIDVDKALQNNQFLDIVKWLQEHIHCLGALYTADEILEKVCHESFDPNIYIDYLIDKYSKLYQFK